MLSIFKRSKLERLDIRFSDWIVKISNSSQPGNEIKAINFGILQTEESYSIYLIGSVEYDPNDDDWACNEDFIPDEKYFALTKQEIIDKDWTMVQDMIINVIKSFLDSELYNDSILKAVDHITCGFDGGSLEKIK